MRLAVISDTHVLGPGEHEIDRDVVAGLLGSRGMLRGAWQHFLHAARKRFWNWKPESRRACFFQALMDIQQYGPDWVVANGDYGGDAAGIGLSDAATYESAAGAITLMREIFDGRCRFIFGDHDLGKYSTALRQGGIRLASLERGERDLQIQTFWHEQVEEVHLLGINSSLLTLDHFLPEALAEEIPQWRERQAAHEQQITEAFDRLAPSEKIILFCHDPGALGVLIRSPVIRQKQKQIALTVLGHLHEPRLLTLVQRMPRWPNWRPKYPVARIISESLKSAGTWSLFNPVVCPSPFGTGHHLSGGVLFIERSPEQQWLIRRHRICLPRHAR